MNFLFEFSIDIFFLHSYELNRLTSMNILISFLQIVLFDCSLNLRELISIHSLFKVCQQHYLSSTNMELIHSLRTQLIHHLKCCGYLNDGDTSFIESLNIHSGDWSSIQSVLTAALYPRIANFHPTSGTIVLGDEGGDSIIPMLHPSCKLLFKKLDQQVCSIKIYLYR